MQFQQITSSGPSAVLYRLPTGNYAVMGSKLLAKDAEKHGIAPKFCQGVVIVPKGVMREFLAGFEPEKPRPSFWQRLWAVIFPETVWH